MAHVKNNSGNEVWNTPPWFLESARKVMGSVDCDPASNEAAQNNVQAKVWYSKEQNGLEQGWIGNVWLNPPYSRGVVGQFVDKLLSLPNQAIILVNNATESSWGQRLLGNCDAVCFPNKRIRFLSVDGEKGVPLQGQMICYFGDNSEGFMLEFSQYGVVFT